MARSRATFDQFAIKVIPKKQMEGYEIHSDLIENEIKTLQKISHPNMIKIYELLHDD